METLERSWFPVAWSRDLRRKPQRCTVLDRQFVLFRTRDGSAAALENRCPHRGVELSTGRAVDGGLRCRYHGWLFDGSGRCTQVPSQLPAERTPNVRVPALRTHESDGAVWVTLAPEPYQPEPEPWQFPDHRAFLVDVEIDCDYVRVMENLVDASHAAFLHAGLLRGTPKTEVCAQVKQTPRGVHVRTDGEKARGSLLYRVAGQRGGDVLHTEEFVAPNIVKLVYVSGPAHSTSQFVVVPTAETRTRLFGRVTVRVPGLTAAVFPVVRAAIRRIIRQDVAIMEDMAATERLFPGRRTTSVRGDTPSVWLARAAEDFHKNGPHPVERPQSTAVHYKL
jgi:phenylpropionate dioxygenase-like ring-hydroxylating dioxygenase large terminal subunit